MLRELHIQNLAVISDARIELSAGLNCFTGATGAGKSLVIGAVEVLLGMRSPGEMLRRGAEEGRVSGVFEVKDKSILERIEAVTDVPVSGDGGELLLTRRLFASGRSSVSLNGRPITLSMLKLTSEFLVDVHGQHDHQYLLKPSNQLDVLDAFAGTVALREKYAAVWTELSEARHRLAELGQGRSLRDQQLELYRFQAGEIDAAELAEGEYEGLQAKAVKLGNVEKIRAESSAAYAALSDSDDNLVERLKSVVSDLTDLAALDPGLQQIVSTAKDSTLALQEVAFDLGRYVDKLDVDPEELALTNDRLTVINRLASKYAGRLSKSTEDEVAAVLAFRAELGRKIADLETQTEDLTGLTTRLAPMEKEAKKLAAELSAARAKVASPLARDVEGALAELGMERAKFVVSIVPAELGTTGADNVEFIATTNPGLSPAPLRKIASGGELSRIMLALKGILAAGDRVSVLVFDEIDSNVGGRLGAIIGAKLRQLARDHQVLCITHLPQIAAYADRHLTVRKSQSQDETTSTVRVMDGAERVAEIAEMIGGQHITETTRAQARELLEAGKSPGKPAKAAARR